ncbi:hypothetical protein ERJ75_000955600 [Trypanosoma vivax]|uniref:IQ calmodulin-binding protein n=1 Tax=Trypanosoma vivax (strain Y486) TaxID=1055687 RepID=G0U4Q5_TRYVY|nr:hypothetical protein TRVL_00310 [Trypanosoma vivax]KAH8611777.1 hypothetical protein ERJ75_000955600 [Trypanosoma vivax]CCC52419.1 conserved hypothetical protein [Trypanosoma vivax Y486]
MLKQSTRDATGVVPINVFNGGKDEIMFPMRTLYCPPVPPSMLVGRYKPPPKSPYKYLNDISLAGRREHLAQVEIARLWRGVRARRRLRNERTVMEVRISLAKKIQRWWRFLLAKWKKEKLTALKEIWLKERNQGFLANRLDRQKMMMTWQRRRFEGAVTKVQRVFRWYMERQREYSLSPEERTEKPVPLEYKRKVYFPWRKAKNDSMGAANDLALVDSAKQQKATEDDEAVFRFRKTRKEPVPPSYEEVKKINDAMREKEAKRAQMYDQPEVHERAKWKSEGLLENDFDHNAGMIQRFVKIRWDATKMTTRKISREYLEKKVYMIQRAFRVYKTLTNMRIRAAGLERRSRLKNDAFVRARLDHFADELAWQRALLDNAARTIQKYWAFYKSRLEFCQYDNDTEGAERVAPRPPRCNLLNDHIAREKVLRNAARSQMERELEAVAGALRKSHGERYKPEKLLIVREENVYIPAGDSVKAADKV